MEENKTAKQHKTNMSHASPAWSMLSTSTGTEPNIRRRKFHCTLAFPSTRVVTSIQCIVRVKYSRRIRERHRSHVKAGRIFAQSSPSRSFLTAALYMLLI
jgi:hypothetical protein